MLVRARLRVTSFLPVAFQSVTAVVAHQWSPIVRQPPTPQLTTHDRLNCLEPVHFSRAYCNDLWFSHVWRLHAFKRTG